MKKIGFFLGFGLVIMSVFIGGCTSAKPLTQGNAGTDGISVTPVSLDGYWELPEGDIFFFEKNAFILLDSDGDVDINGILFDQTSTQLILHFYNKRTMSVNQFTIAYKIVSNGNIEASVKDKDATWINGTWKKRNDLNNEMAEAISVNPVLGYWERKQESQITIYHFYPAGVGFQYMCEPNYLLFGARGGDITLGEITFDTKKLPMDKFQLATTRGDSRSTGGFKMEMQCVIDGDDLLIGIGNDPSKYARYTR